MSKRLESELRAACLSFADEMLAVFKSNLWEFMNQDEGKEQSKPEPSSRMASTRIKPPKAPKALAGTGRANPPHCIAPDCTIPHRGPRGRFLCAVHANSFTSAQVREFSDHWKATRYTMQAPDYGADVPPA